MEISLSALQESLKYSELEWAFGEMVARRSGNAGDAGLQLLAAAALHATAESHSCLDLEPWLKKMKDIALPGLAEWTARVENEWKSAIANPEENTPPVAPLVWVKELNALYLQQYYQAEETIRDYVGKLPPPTTCAPASETVKKLSARFDNPNACDQIQAVATVFQQRFGIITGGPGTGKTTTLAALLALELQKNPELRIALCAPTGKAATQMFESILAEKDQNLQVDDEVKSQMLHLPHQTIHKLLGINKLRDGLPKFSQAIPLPYDLVVVDECSMVDLLLFRKLLNALPPGARLLLMGDKDQLDSVEAGKVFSALCQHAQQQGIPCASLKYNFRSSDNPRLVENAQRMVSGGTVPDDAVIQEILAAMYDLSVPSVGAVFAAEEWTGREKPEALARKLRNLVEAWLGQVPRYASAADALNHLNDFKVLCAIHEGPCGTKVVNRILGEIFLAGSEPSRFPDGLPLMVTRNDAVTGLRNGEVGVCWDGEVHFEGGRIFRPGLLPDPEVAFAMTVHKAQGASYENVVLVLPFQDSELLTVNLIYTAITRARQNCLVLGRRTILAKALKTATHRWGHLFDAGSQGRRQQASNLQA